MKKIAVSTFNNSKNNYGALFQSCGLCSFLTKMGYDVSYVTVTNRAKAKKGKAAKVKALIKKIINLPKKKLFHKKTQAFINFAEKTQNQIKYENTQQLKANPPKADVYISGSDQVWNPKHINEDFFLTYAPAGAKKISYAASMGNEIVPDCNRERFEKYIKEYQHISVREDTMIDIISKYTDKPVHQNIDPVFLKTKEEWLALSEEYPKLKYDKFILVYVLEWEEEHFRKLQQLKKLTGLPIVSVSIGNIKRTNADQIIYDASPEQFLYLLSRAEYVVATSFHGTAMSIIFNKPFLAFLGKDKPTRIESLMRHFGIENYDSIESLNNKTDYEAINKIIAEDRKTAKEYLLNAIEN